MGFFNNKKDKKVSFGQHEHKTLHKHLNFTATEQYKLLRTNIDFTLSQDEKCHVIGAADSISEIFSAMPETVDVIIADECQFFTEAQIDELRQIVDLCDVPVLCFGLRTDFLTKLFPGSRRLFEVADSVAEIKTICGCGKKATVNARIDENDNVVTEGSQVMLGGNDCYLAMCHKCWRERIRAQRNN